VIGNEKIEELINLYANTKMIFSSNIIINCSRETFIRIFSGTYFPIYIFLYKATLEQFLEQEDKRINKNVF